MRVPITTIAAGATTLLLVCSPAKAEEPANPAPAENSREWQVSAEVLTDYPLHVGVAGRLEGPYRILLHTSVGIMPSLYMDSVNSIAESAGWYDEYTAALVSAAMRNAFVWRIRPGWRPFARHGFYFAGGYTFAGLGRDTTAAALVSEATDVEIPNGVADDLQFEFSSTVHMIDVEVGWVFNPVSGLIVRPAIGGAFTLHSTTQVELSGDVPRGQSAASEVLASAAETYLDDIFQTYMHTVTISLAAGWRF